MVKKIKFFCSLQKKENKKQGRWSQEEQERFLKWCYFFKNDWEKIKEYIKTRTIPQIRSHAQKYLIKICRKYSIKLSKKKFCNRLSKHLDITKIPYKGKSNISNMSIYEKNILEMFNYYNREVIIDDNSSTNNTEDKSKNIQLFNKLDASSNNNIQFPTNSININKLNNIGIIDNNTNIKEKLENINENMKVNNIIPFSLNTSLLPIFPNILQNIQSNNNLKPCLKQCILPSSLQNPNIPFILNN